MAGNRLAGSGPTMPGDGGDGPSAGLSGTMGATPQAAPQAAPNMLSGAQPQQQQQGQPQAAQGQPGAPLVPPSHATLIDVFHRGSYVVSALKQLLSKPDLKTKDILDTVGEIVADQVMSPFDAAKYLADMPTQADPLQLRQWVGQHYANSAKNLQTVAEMLHAHGAMTRRMAQQPPQMMPPDASPQMPPPDQSGGNLLSQTTQSVH